MAGHCVVGWLLSKQKWQEGALWNDVADDVGGKDYCVRCGCW